MGHSSKLCAKNFPVLALLTETELEAFNDLATEIEVPSDEAVISEGIQNASLYFVLSGMLVVSKRHDGQVIEVATNGTGQFFGETSVLDNVPTSAEVRTVVRTRLLLVPDTVVLGVIAQNDKFSRALRQTSRRRAACTALAVNQLFKVLPKSVRETLLYNAEMTEFVPNQFILTEGDNNIEYMYLLVSGQCEAFVHNPIRQHQRIVVAHFVAGDVFGEVPLITGGEHEMSVHTQHRCVLLKIPTELIGNWMLRYRDFSLVIEQYVKLKSKHYQKLISQDIAAFQEEINHELDVFQGSLGDVSFPKESMNKS